MPSFQYQIEDGPVEECTLKIVVFILSVILTDFLNNKILMYCYQYDWFPGLGY